jgi:hypothetical protein
LQRERQVELFGKELGFLKNSDKHRCSYGVSIGLFLFHQLLINS